MARRLEPPAPGADVGGADVGGGVEATREPMRTVPSLDLTAPAIIGIAPSAQFPATRPSAPQVPVPHVPAAQFPAAQVPAPDVRLLNRVREGLRELAEQPSAAQPRAHQSTASRDTASRATAPRDTAAQGTAGSSLEADGELDAIRRTFGMVQAGGDDAAAYFYGWLFTANPELRDLFPPAMDEQRDRLFAALMTIVGALGAPAELRGYLAGLGRDHRKHSVRPDMYQAVGDALIATLRAFAGSELTPAAEKAWLGIYRTASEIMIKAGEQSEAGAPAFWTAQVVRHERRVPGMAVVTVAPDQPLPYQPGQHVAVQTKRWPKVWRPYSVAGRPRADGLLTFHVKAISGGWVSNALVQHTVVGDELILGAAVGRMLLAEGGSRDLVCVAGGTGLAPIKAIAEQVVADEATAAGHRNVALFWGVGRESELYDLDDLWRLSDVYPWLQVHPVTSDDQSYPGMRGNVGQVAARYLPHLDCEAYVAGPSGMVRETVDLLGQAGLPPARVHYDESVLSPRRRVGSGT